ncbi:MAG: hypothetical protein JNL74_21250 [Fibrobacteres bacterium]|nr:hypothetical protein [Fibrobacterota bacterium]
MNLKTRNTESVSASVKDIQFYNKSSKKTSKKVSLSSSIDVLVKSGQLTQEQAKLVRSADKNNMFGTLLDAMKNNYDNGSDKNSSSDPFSTLLDAFNSSEKNKSGESPLFDSFVRLMPVQKVKKE